MTSNEKLELARKRVAELKARGTDRYIQDANSPNNARSKIVEQEEATLSAQKLVQALEEIALLKEQNRRFKEKIEKLESKVASYENPGSVESNEAHAQPLPKAEPTKPEVTIAVEPLITQSKPVSRNEELQHWKGWQVDLRGWKTLGVGPQIDI